MFDSTVIILVFSYQTILWKFKILATHQHVTTQSLRRAAVEVWIVQEASKQIYLNMATDQSE